LGLQERSLEDISGVRKTSPKYRLKGCSSKNLLERLGFEKRAMGALLTPPACLGNVSPGFASPSQPFRYPGAVEAKVKSGPATT
jgi:hypothetical protein